MNTKSITILALVAGAAVVGAIIATRSDKATTPTPSGDWETPAPSSPSLFTGLSSRINDVTAVTVKSASGESNIELTEGQWRIKEKSGYPVEAAKVREVILALTGLRNFDAKTARPDMYKSIGVEDVVAAAPAAKPDPASPTPPVAQPEVPKSLLVTLKDKAGQPITSVIVGNTKYSQTPGQQGIYLRKPGDTQSWYAEGKLDVPREPLTWVNNEFADIGRDRVRSVTLTPRGDKPDADRIVVTKEKPAEGAFVVQGIPPGKQLKDAGLSETIVAGLVKTAFEDVNKLDAIDFAGNDDTKGKPGPTVDVRTWDGLIVHVETAEANGRQWWKLSAMPDPDPFKETPAAIPTPPPAAGADPNTPPPTPPPSEPKPKRTPEEVNKEVAELNAKWAGWAFSPFSYKSSAFTKKLSDELKDPAPPTPPPAPPGEPGATPMPFPVPKP